MIWPHLLLTTAAAVTAGSLAVPATRRFMLGSIKNDWLQDELELDCIEPDGLTIRLKGGSFARVWRLQGTSYDARIEQEQHTLLLGRTALIHELGRKGLSLRFLAVKRKHPIHYESTWPGPVLNEIGKAEASLFRASYKVDWYLVVCAGTMQPLIEAEQIVAARGAIYKPQPLERPEDSDAHCPLTGFFNGLVSGDYRGDLPPVSRNLSAALPGADLDCDKESGIITAHVPDRKLHRIIGVLSWPETVSGRLASRLLALNGDLELCQICEPWHRDNAALIFKRKEQAAKGALFGNPAAAAETAVILSMIAEGNTTLFTTQFQIVARADNEVQLERLVRGICEILGDLRVLYRIETAGAPLCWFGRLPAPPKGRVTPGAGLMIPLTLRDENIAALWAFPHAATGLASSQFGAAPVRWFRTPSGQAYAFQFHVEDKPQARGNYLVFAPTGGGKSTLMMHLLGGLAKFEGVRTYIFDSKEGARFMVEAMGGHYQGYEDLALNPLDIGTDSAANRQRLYHFLRVLTGNMELDATDKAALAHTIDLAFSIDPPQRTLSALFQFAFPRRSNLRHEMSKWIVDDKGNRGIHAHVFNAPHDSLGTLLGHYMVAINMNEALSDPELGPPVVAHMASAIGQSAAKSAKGFTIFIDEAAKLLQNDGFRALAAEMFREYRKLNGAVGLAFQDPAALTRSGMAEAFIENTATFIFLPNAQATPESFAPFNLNDEQMSFVLGRSGSGRERRALIVKRDAASGFDESAIIDVDLAPMGDALRFYRAGTDANRHLADLKATWGDQWQTRL